MEECILCKNRHDEIYSRFTNYFVPDSITESQYQEFPKFIQFELNEGNWTGVYCIITNIIKKYQRSNSINEYAKSIMDACIFLERKFRNQPSLAVKEFEEKFNSRNKISENVKKHIKEEMDPEEIEDERQKVLNCLIHIDELDDLKKLLMKKEFQKEIEKPSLELKNMPKALKELENFSQLSNGIDKLTIVREQLKNYTLLRIVSIYERIQNDVLIDILNSIPLSKIETVLGKTTTIDTKYLLNPDKFDLGKHASANFNNSPITIRENFKKIVQVKIENMNFNTSKEFNFFKIMDQIIKIKIQEDKESKSTLDFTDTFEFLQAVNSERNNMTHELRSTKFTDSELRRIIIFYDVFFQVFKPMIHLILNLLINESNEKRKIIYEDFENLVERLEHPLIELSQFNVVTKAITDALVPKNQDELT